MISPPQYRKLMKSYSKTKKIAEAAREAGLDRKTARKYVRGAGGPQEPREERKWRTHPDVFGEVWPDVERQLWQEPQLQAKTLFTALQRQHPGRFLFSQRRSFERRVRRWKLEHGQEPPVVFRQEHRPGESLQLDWWDANELGITVAGEAYRHKLAAVVLPYSNWQWAQPARSESFLSLKSGLQAALWELGKAPRICQTDQSSTATHAKGKGQRGREFNERYLGLLAHYAMKPRTIALSSPEQNGDVESAHRHLKEALDQGLRLRGSREFASLEAYEGWLKQVLRERNRERAGALEREREQMADLPSIRLPEYEELSAWVSREALVRVGKQAYSVPARYIGQQVRVRIEEAWLSFYCAQQCIERTPRPTGNQGVYVNWKHVLPQLRRKPGAMSRWRHRASLFPNATWRRAFDEMHERVGERQAEREYLGLLALALDHGVAEVESHLSSALLAVSGAGTLEQVQAALGRPPGVPSGKVIVVDFQADLSGYDTLLERVEAEMNTSEEPAKEVQHGR